jgi:hypothetical protein
LPPLQSPLALHELGLLVVAQVNATAEPGVTGPIGLLAIVTIGRLGGGLTTATVDVAKPEPAPLLQVKV